MPRRLRILIAIALGAAIWAGCGSETPSDPVETQIEFESLTFPGAWLQPFQPPIETGRPVTVGGTLRIPATTKPVPLVVIAHGCGGVSGAALGWSRDLEAAGIGSLVLDSFEGRGLSSVCSGSEGVTQASLLVDAFRAVDAVGTHPSVDESQIAIMGLSMGGRTALWSAQERFQGLYDGRPFAAYVAFYPLGCYIELENETQVAGGPIRIFHGEDDDWLPIGQCRTYTDRMAAGGVDIGLFAYPDAQHAFDDRGLTEGLPIFGALSPRTCVVVERGGVLEEVSRGGPATAENSCVERGAAVAHNPDARAAASVNLFEFLDSVFDT